MHQTEEESLGSRVKSKTDHTVGSHLAKVVKASTGHVNPYNKEKEQVELELELDDGNIVKLWATLAFGSSPTLGYAKLANIIEACFGLPCGDPRQRKVTISQFVGKVLTVTTGLNNGYPRILDFASYGETVEPEVVF